MDKATENPNVTVRWAFRARDLRKFAEQHGDVIQWEQSNRAYVLTHGVSGVDWRFYKHPLPDSVYDVYMEYWSNASFKLELVKL